MVQLSPIGRTEGQSGKASAGLSRRKFLAAAGLTAGAGALSACSPAASSGSSGAVTIEYWHQFSEAYGGKAMEQLIADFNAKNPDIRVNSVYKNADTPTLELLQPAFVAGARPPDLTSLNFRDLTVLAANGFPYTPITELNSGDAATDFLSGIPENLLNACRVQGQQIAVPLYITLMIGIYNVPIFKEAGIDPSTLTTWDDWRKAATVIKAKINRPPLWLHLTSSGFWGTENLVRSNGADIVNCAADGARAAFADPLALEALELWTGLAADGLSEVYQESTARTAFQAGTLPIVFTSAGAYGTFKKQVPFEIAGTPLPQFGSKSRQLPVAGKAMVCFSKDKATRSASWKLIQFLASPKSQEAFDDATGYLPVVNGTAVPTEPFRALAREQVQYAVDTQVFPGPQSSEATVAVFKGITSMLNDKSTAQIPQLASTVSAMIEGQTC